MTLVGGALNDLVFIPYWLDHPDAPAIEPELTAKTETDLLIVGGGFTGLWAGGYPGLGVSASRFGARIGLALLDDPGAAQWQYEFVQTLPNRIPPEPFRWLGAAITLYAIDTADEKGGWRPYWLRFIRRLGFPLS